MNAEFVVGGDGGQRTQALVWLPESVVLIDAPALYDPHDRNTYNNEQAIRALVPLLEVKP